MIRNYIRYLRDKFFDIYACKSYSQEGEDMVLRRIFEGNEQGFYVDVGAHHPKRFSNTFYFYRKGWQGINIEPNPEGYALLKQARKRDVNIQCGISEQTGEMTYVMFNDSALDTFDVKLAHERESTTPYEIIEERNIKVRRLEDVLGQHLLPNQEIDFLTVDAEGHDLAVLESNNWSKFRPKLVLVEELGLSNFAEAKGKVGEFLSRQDYVLFAKTLNTLFFKDNRISDI